jgi:two-component system, sensor histidine kinase and response regulator
VKSNRETRGRILIVDDEEVFRGLIRDQLLKHNFIIDEAENGEDALRFVKEHDYNIILLDIKMEKMNGIETLKEIRRITTKTDVVMVTGYADIPNAVECIRLGARNFLTKPIDPSILLSQISTLLQLQSETQYLQEVQIDFPTLVMHKLRIPLSTVKSAVNLLNKGLENIVTDKQRDLLNHIDEHISKINATINDLVDLAQLEAGSAPLEKFPTNLDELVPAVCSRVEPCARAKNITLTLSTDKNVPTLEIDADKIEKVLINLLDNAVNYTFSGGKINVTTTAIQKEFDGKLREYVEVSVSDSGFGIAQDALPFIFDKYKPNLTNKEKSTGLGLALCKAIVEAHGGYIVAESVVSKGSTFRFAIPAEINSQF